MTSTERGTVGGRNSSRVLRPPGGGSSNIFGLSDEPPKPTKVCDTAEVAKPEQTIQEINCDTSIPETFNNNEDVKDNIDDDAVEAVEECLSEDLKAVHSEEIVDEKIELAQVNVEATSQPTETKTQSTPIQGRYNPITGEGQQPCQEVPKSVRVRQPPGGASTKLW